MRVLGDGVLGWSRPDVIDIGSVVNGKYRLVRLLGDGGMGSVYEAVHAVLGTRVAIKVLHPELARRTGLVERFLQEARVAAQIRSPHVVQVTDVDRTPDGQAYIVMELLEGEPLSGVLDRQRKLSTTTACEYALQILQALEAAHALGVIHRDLKPENVFVTFAGGRPVLKLIDFGIAKARRTDPQARNLTVAGVVMGTAEYMAPEQARSADKVDARADVYAVGVMLYEMIAGVRPVSGDDARVVALKVERGEVVPLVQAAPEVPREIAGPVHRAMAARPELRFASATEMRLALEKALAGRRPATAAVAAPPASHAPPMPAAGELTATGTLKNVSAQQLLAGHPSMAAGRTPVGAEPELPPVDTIRAAPVATALAPPVYVGAGTPPAPFGEAPRPRRGGRTFAIVALSLLLGGGVVAVVAVSGTWASNGPTPGPTAPTASPTALPQPMASATSEPGTSPATTPGATAAQPPSAIPSLLSNRQPPPPTPRPSSSVRPPPASAEDAGPPPPFVFPSGLPSTLPPFPSVLPLPAGFPTSFPSVLPAWPPAPVPSAAPAPSK
jgi:serine/threonine-protein kinase